MISVEASMISKEELIQSALKDPKLYLENFCKIKTKRGGLSPFILNNTQLDLFNNLLGGESERFIILKARQLGLSTAVVGFLYHRTITSPGINTAIIGYNSDLTAELLDKIKIFIRSTPPELRPTIQYNSKYEISFPKIDSKILVLPSTENVGRGYTLHNVLCTELAFWDKAEEKMNALENSVPPKGGLIVVESTPASVGNMYHKMWVMPDSGYTKLEYGWWWLYSEEEKELIKKRVADPIKFAQEYELQFLSTGRPVFDMQLVKSMRKNILSVGDDVYEFDENGEKKVVGKVEEEFVKGNQHIRIYKRPQPGGLYVVGADVAEGVEGGDYSFMTIWDRKTGEEVAMFRGLLTPGDFGEFLDKWGRIYNNGLMVVEHNNQGIATLQKLKELSYPCMYFRPTKYESVYTGLSDKIGWRTTPTNKSLLIDQFQDALRKNEMIIHSKETLDEMLVFIYNDNNDMVVPKGFHDDGIMSSSIGYQGFKVMYSKPLEQIDESEHLPTNFSY